MTLHVTASQESDGVSCAHQGPWGFIALEILEVLYWVQVHWLRENEGSTALMKEVEAEGKRVWKFVIDREIEAPERFRAIQSYRSADACGDCTMLDLVSSRSMLLIMAF